MSAELLAMAMDPSMTPDAVRVVLFFASLGDGEHAYDRDALARILEEGGERRISKALQRAEREGYLERVRGGRGSDRFRVSPAYSAGETVPAKNLSPAESAGENLSPAQSAGEKPLSPAHSAGENCASTTTDTSPSSTSKDAREPEWPQAPETDQARLRLFLGDHDYAVKMMAKSARHPTTWCASIYGKYGPNGTQQHAFRGIPPPRIPSLLATVIIDYAGKQVAFENRHFDGFVRKAVQSELRNPKTDTDDGTPGLSRSGRAQPQAPGAPAAKRGRYDAYAEDGDARSTA